MEGGKSDLMGGGEGGAEGKQDKSMDGKGAKDKQCKKCKYNAKVNREDLCKSCEVQERRENECGDGKSVPQRQGEARVDSGKDECGKCSTVVKGTQQGALCELCDRWFHCKCVNITAEEYRHMQKPEYKMPWYCPDCRGSLFDLCNQNKQLKKENQVLKEENKQLKEELHKMNGKIDELKDYVKQEINNARFGGPDKRELIETIKEEVREELREEQDRKVRKNNLVLYNVNESRNAIPKERQKEDETICEDVFSHDLKVESFHIEQVVRLGKVRMDDKRPRPLLVKLKEASEKYNILKEARNIRTSNLEDRRKIIIAPDLTKKQREEEKILRAQLKEKRDNGDFNWYIKNGKLCKKNFQ